MALDAVAHALICLAFVYVLVLDFVTAEFIPCDVDDTKPGLQWQGLNSRNIGPCWSQGGFAIQCANEGPNPGEDAICLRMCNFFSTANTVQPAPLSVENNSLMIPYTVKAIFLALLELAEFHNSRLASVTM
ncbi:hypothetical protein PoB_001281400 [Plakobranchus ocellatus]|uniref:Secreted protein n=1 Tax=Plakobranchus ocellatus TaxID=259542 RepID=A0AAV3YTC1_9GAST|nr:hypothetical protein PoB_001281400 [Plakobranchus ocellatus]